jgi:DNA repair ATPase RecN
MRLLVVLLCALTIGLSAQLVYQDQQSAVWTDRATRADAIYKLNLQIQQAHNYSRSLVDAVRTLATENGLLCEREAKATQVLVEFEQENRNLKRSLAEAAKATQVLVEFEQENRNLKRSLAEACNRLDKQQDEINDLIDERDVLMYKLMVLEKALSLLPAEVKKKAADTAGTDFLENMSEAAGAAAAILPLLF